MRRVPWVRVGVSVVLGVVLTLVMAWVVPNLGPFGFRSDRFSAVSADERHVSIFRLTLVGGEQIGVVLYDPATLPAGTSWGESIEPSDPRVPGWYVDPSELPADWWGTVIQSQGLPFRCVSSRSEGRRLSANATDFDHEGAWAVNRPHIGQWAFGRAVWELPYLVEPFGFVANVTIYSLLAFAMIFGYGIAARARRRQRSMCIACGYDLAGIIDRLCPECGSEPRKSKPRLANGS